MPVMPAGVLGSQRYPTLVYSGPASERSVQCPVLLGLPRFPLPLWCPVQGCAGNVARLSSHHMSDPSPSPSYDNGTHAVLLAAGEKMFVGDGLGQNVSRILLRFLGVEGGQFVQ